MTAGANQAEQKGVQAENTLHYWKKNVSFPNFLWAAGNDSEVKFNYILSIATDIQHEKHFKFPYRSSNSLMSLSTSKCRTAQILNTDTFI